MSSDLAPGPPPAKRGWRRMAFASIAENVTDRVDDPSVAGVDRYVGLEHLDPDCLTVRRWGTPLDVKATKLRFRDGDVIFGRRRAYQRKLAQAHFDGICSAHAMVLRARPSVVSAEFLPLLMQTDYFFGRAIAISVGGLSPTINWTALAGEEFDVPPLSEQEHINRIVRNASMVGDAWRCVAEGASTMIASALAELLDTGEGERASCKSLVLRKPQNGLSLPANDEGRGMRTLSIGAIKDGRVVLDGHTKWVDVASEDIDRYLLQSGDVLVVRGNGNRDLTARCGIVGELPHEYFYPDLLIRLVFNPERILPEFAALQWNSAAVQHALKRRAKTTNGIWKVNGKDVAQQELQVPPPTTQDRFLKWTERLRQLCDQASRREAQSRSLMRGLLERYLG